MKIIYMLLVMMLFIGCQKKEAIIEENDYYPFFVGTYTDGDSKGIYKYLLEKNGKLNHLGLAAVSNNPSFLTKSFDNKFLLAVNEINNESGVGTIESYLIKDDSLKYINQKSTGGAHPCFVSINQKGFVLTTNYSGGNVGLLKLDKKGELSDLLDVQQHSGNDITDRQESAHAHSVWFEPKSNNIISLDLGTNELWFSQLDSIQQKLIPADQQKLKMKSGAGPRHLTFHPNNKWLYVINELSCTITLVKKISNGQYERGESISTLPEGYTEPNFCADIHISSDGKFLYASNRGHNSIAIYSVNKTDGSLNIITHESVRGKWPRNFSLSPDEKYLVVANQHTNNIVSFLRDKNSGLLKYVDEIKAPTPVCVLF